MSQTRGFHSPRFRHDWRMLISTCRLKFVCCYPGMASVRVRTGVGPHGHLREGQKRKECHQVEGAAARDHPQPRLALRLRGPA
eukprot:5679652-Pyramimonas_sp.AAC.1